MGKILVEGIKLYGYHGCMEEEARVGRSFVVDVEVEADLSKAASTDKISDTVNYVTIYEIVKEEMKVRANLIEHVGKRIYDHLRKTFPAITKAKVKVTKLNPPINGTVDSVSVVISE